MNYKCSGILVVLIFLSSCELLPKLTQVAPESDVNVINEWQSCVWKKVDVVKTQECDIRFWLEYWTSLEAMDWSQRKSILASLSNQNVDVLRKIILSQGQDTPYQDRLRAQIWAESLMPKLSKVMHKFMLVAIYRPSLERLEMESALVTMSKTNSRYVADIEQQKQLLSEQAEKIQQLLNIEASLIQGEQGASQ
ncbi:hypothetical protein L0668_01240 [Paraglaciecola aquimarina]|uniref:Two-component system QseEF-associated lipoprotein QseG n=1 Tax=Paraglaciecola algarum TaxID=3050085 RepID=A0ABS9D1H6_9ALTE|nr:hypothetical protein [Paraglaciecola sp. G1-23]MCF2946716.1 hypothetical protein [Paraglaciecola sp. G1-23]